MRTVRMLSVASRPMGSTGAATPVAAGTTAATQRRITPQLRVDPVPNYRSVTLPLRVAGPVGSQPAGSGAAASSSTDIATPPALRRACSDDMELWAPRDTTDAMPAPACRAPTPGERPTPRYLRDDFVPLSVVHPAFGQQQAVVRRSRRGPPLSTVHPAFGTQPKPLAQHLFRGPIGVSGFFFAVDPNVALLGAKNKMNPNAQLTIRDQAGNSSRVRYRCQLEAGGGIKVEALVRFQVGWISPRVTFSEVPNVIHLGRGFDLSIPFLFHFTMVSVLDERGCATGSSLYFSGTPMIGLSIGFSPIRGGKLILDPSRDLNPQHETRHHFIGHVHYRQVGFVVFKVAMWVMFTLACLPWVRRWLINIVPNPLTWYSEERRQN